MALSEADYEQFIEAMHADPVLRDRVRNAILADDFLRLPGLVAQLVEHSHEVDRQLALLAAHMDKLVERMDGVAAATHDLTRQVRSMDGRMGLMEGMQFEEQYVKNLGGRLGPRFRRVRVIAPWTLAQLSEAVKKGQVTEAEWDDVMLLDAVAWAVNSDDPLARDVMFAFEISRVVEHTDVERAHRRAGILRKAGLPAIACVDGGSIRTDSAQLAASLEVQSFVRSTAA